LGWVLGLNVGCKSKALIACAGCAQEISAACCSRSPTDKNIPNFLVQENIRSMRERSFLMKYLLLQELELAKNKEKNRSIRHCADYRETVRVDND
jgi:disulfide oxidoreductase YuzD